VNLAKFILAVPAGKEMKVRTTGRQREMKTVNSP
jgi:hypothetical protein